MSVKIGIVGNGWWVDSMYLPALKNFELADVVGICGRDQAKTQKLAEKWNIPFSFFGPESYLELLNHVDALIIASSTNTHFKIAKDALLAGKHVFCEKPLTTNLNEAQELLTLATLKNIHHQIAYTYFYLPEFQFLIDYAKTESVSRFSMEWLAGFMANVTTPNEKYNALLGNHLLADVGSHFFFLAYRMFGPIESVNAMGFPSKLKTSHSFIPSELGGSVHLKFSNGTVGTILIITDVLTKRNSFNMSQKVTLKSSSGEVESYNDWHEIQTLKSINNSGEITDITEKLSQFTTTYWTNNPIVNYKNIFRTTDTMARLFCKSIASGQQTDAPNFNDGVYVQRVVDAVLESLSTNRVVKINSAEKLRPLNNHK